MFLGEVGNASPTLVPDCAMRSVCGSLTRNMERGALFLDLVSKKMLRACCPYKLKAWISTEALSFLTNK